MKLEWDKPYACSCDSEFKQIAATANMFEVLYARQKQEAEDKIYFSSATSTSGMSYALTFLLKIFALFFTFCDIRFFPGRRFSQDFSPQAKLFKINHFMNIKSDGDH